MNGWTISFSPGNFACQCRWGDSVCGIIVPAGYVIAKHPNWPDEWCCLNCMLAVVRQHQRTLLLEVPR